MENLPELMAALGAGTVLAKLVDYWIKSREKKREKDKAFTNIFKAVHQVYHVLQVILTNCKAKRVLILKTTNGGGRPKLTGRLYGSVLYEVVEKPLVAVKEDWQNQILDESYLEILFQMSRDGYSVISTDEMQQGILKDVYITQGIEQSWLYEIAQRENEYVYLSVNFTDLDDQDTQVKNLFRVAVSQLVNLFNNHKNL